MDDGVITAGQCVGLIDDVPTCAELIERIVRDVAAGVARVGDVFLINV